MANENLTTYTEVDTGERLTVTVPKADANAVIANIACYLHKDFLADHFNALDTDFEIYCEDPAEDLGFAGVGFADVIGSPGGAAEWGATDPVLVMFYHPNTNAYIRLIHGDDSGEDDYVGSKDTPYYCTMSRAAGNDSISVLIYSDAARTNLLDTLTLTGFGTTKWQYFYPFVAFLNVAVTREFDGYTQNIDLHEAIAAAELGAFYQKRNPFGLNIQSCGQVRAG